MHDLRYNLFIDYVFVWSLQQRKSDFHQKLWDSHDLKSSSVKVKLDRVAGFVKVYRKKSTTSI